MDTSGPRMGSQKMSTTAANRAAASEGSQTVGFPISSHSQGTHGAALTVAMISGKMAMAAASLPSCSEALAWCVKLVGRHEAEWILIRHSRWNVFGGSPLQKGSDRLKLRTLVESALHKGVL